MTRRARVALAAFVALALAPQVTAQTCLFLEQSWTSHEAPYRINPNFPDTRMSGTPEQQVEQLMCSASAWTDQTRADFRFVFEGTSSLVGIAETDGTNNISFVDEDGFGAVAITVYDGDLRSGMKGFDIVFFDRTDTIALNWSGPLEPPDIDYVLDITGVGTHELGHGLGLDHIGTMGATMYPYTEGNDLHTRTLAPDDRTCIERLYRTRTGAPQPAPRITSVTPNEGPLGGGNEAVIEGANFTWTSDTRLSIGTVIVSRANYDVESCSRLRVRRMPAGASGSKDVTITNQIGTGSLADGYSHIAAPELVSIQPSVGPTFGGTEVVIRGVDLTPGALAFIGDEPLMDQEFVNSTMIRGVVPPAAAAGPVPVRVVIGGLTLTLAMPFTYELFALRLTDHVATPSEVDVRLHALASSQDGLRGVSFGLAWDPEKLTVKEVGTAGTTTADAEFQRFSLSPERGEATVRVIMGFENNSPLIPAGPDLAVAEVTVDVGNNVDIGEQIFVRFANGLGQPPVSIGFILPNDELLVPRAVDGVITIEGDAPPAFIRGDSNRDESVNISDAQFSLGYLFLSGPRSTCEDAADANDDGTLNLSDAIYTLAFLFQSGPTPPMPFPGPGNDATDDGLDCAAN